MRLAGQPAAQEAGHEGVAGTENVVDLDREALADDAVFEIVGNRAVIDDAAHRPALQHDRRLGIGPDGLQRRKQVAVTRSNQHFLLGTDDQVAIGQNRLQMRRDLLGGDIAVVARIMACKAPEVRAIIDIEDDLGAAFLGDADRLALRSIGVRLGEMRAGDENGAGRTDEILRDIILAQGIVGAIVAVEQEREGMVAFDGENGKRGQPFGIGYDALGFDAFALQLFADEAAHLLLADARQQCRFQAETRRPDRYVGGAAADGFGEAGNVLEPRANLLAV